MNTFTIELKDIKETCYFKYKKNNQQASYQFLGQGHADVEADELLIIDCPASKEIKRSITNNDIVDNNGKVIGYVYSICVEDQTDNDYNDIFFSMAGWDKKE